MSSINPQSHPWFTCVAGFTRVMIDRGEQQNWRNASCVDARGMLNASRVKSVFAKHVRDAIEFLKYGRYVETNFQ